MSTNNSNLFGRPITEVIHSRSSIRTYQEKALLPDDREKLLSLIQSLKGPFNIHTRFKLVDTDIARKESNAKLGTYGVIKGASTFIAAAVEKGERNLEELGYTLEKLILYAASLGLGTCWLGGSFKKGDFAKAMGLKEHEILPIVTPIGYPSANRSFVDTLMRLGAGSKNRKDWKELFFKDSFSTGLSREEAGDYAVPLDMLKLAPSASNKQPWRVVKEGNRYHFYLQHTKGYAKLLAFDIQRIDIGIAMCHFELTAAEVGKEGQWSIQDPSLKDVPQDCDYIVSWVEQ